MTRKKTIARYKDKIPVGEKSVEEIYLWLSARVNLEELTENEILKKYDVYRRLFKYNCNSITGNKQLKIRGFRVSKDEQSKQYYEEMDNSEEAILWIEENNFIIETTSNKLFNDLTILRGVSQMDWENESDRLLEYIICCFDLAR